jgi:hypothetical protein
MDLISSIKTKILNIVIFFDHYHLLCEEFFDFWNLSLHALLPPNKYLFPTKYFSAPYEWLDLITFVT